jgi:LysM repeat protein
MASPRQRRHSSGRWLAPLALLVAGLAIYVVAHPRSSGGGPATTTTTTSRSAGARAKRKPRASKRRTYTVRAGDTLSGIASKTGVSLQRIEALNPKLDSQTLQTGETIKLGP